MRRIDTTRFSGCRKRGIDFKGGLGTSGEHLIILPPLQGSTSKIQAKRASVPNKPPFATTPKERCFKLKKVPMSPQGKTVKMLL